MKRLLELPGFIKCKSLVDKLNLDQEPIGLEERDRAFELIDLVVQTKIALNEVKRESIDLIRDRKAANKNVVDDAHFMSDMLEFMVTIELCKTKAVGCVKLLGGDIEIWTGKPEDVIFEPGEFSNRELNLRDD